VRRFSFPRKHSDSLPSALLLIILAFNAIVAGVAQACGASVADVYSAFSGANGLLLIEKNGAGQFEVHPTNAGYRAIAAAFEAVHR
jgi:lysophospholipase L1-like esterase